MRRNPSNASQYAYPVSDDENERADLVEAILEDPAIPVGADRAAAIQAITNPQPTIGGDWESALVATVELRDTRK